MLGREVGGARGGDALDGGAEVVEPGGDPLERGVGLLGEDVAGGDESSSRSASSGSASQAARRGRR